MYHALQLLKSSTDWLDTEDNQESKERVASADALCTDDGPTTELGVGAIRAGSG